MAAFYRIVRVRPNGVEDVLRDIPYGDVTDEQVQRAEAFRDGKSRGGQRIRVYSSDDNGVVTPGDLIWDSTVNT